MIRGSFKVPSGPHHQPRPLQAELMQEQQREAGGGGGATLPTSSQRRGLLYRPDACRLTSFHKCAWLVYGRGADANAPHVFAAARRGVTSGAEYAAQAGGAAHLAAINLKGAIFLPPLSLPPPHTHLTVTLKTTP